MSISAYRRQRDLFGEASGWVTDHVQIGLHSPLKAYSHRQRKVCDEPHALNDMTMSHSRELDILYGDPGPDSRVRHADSGKRRAQIAEDRRCYMSFKEPARGARTQDPHVKASGRNSTNCPDKILIGTCKDLIEREKAS